MITTPPFLMGAALLFWGAQTGFLFVGIVLAALLEGSRFTSIRWSFSQADFARIWNICVVLFLGSAIYLFVNEGTVSLNEFFADGGRRPEAIREKGRAALLLFQWLPMLLFPLMAAQAFSETRRIDLATFSWPLRNLRSLETEGVNVSFAYVAACVFAASASNRKSALFFAGLAILLAWGLWGQRARRFPGWLWGGLFLVAAAGGFAGQTGLARAQAALERMHVPWFSRYAGGNVDGKQTRTMIGSIGRLKMSDRIVLRVRTNGQPPPDLLREVSYTQYRSSMWHNPGKEFVGVPSETDPASWLLASNATTRGVTIAKYIPRGAGLLPLPLGTAELHQLPYGNLEKSPFGIVRVSGGPGLAMFEARFGQQSTIDDPPMKEDLQIQDPEQPGLTEVADVIGLHEGMEARAAMQLVSEFFQNNFQYSTYLRRSQRSTSNETALARFLLKTRSGHCEYFATATTLLLRKAGLPTRYAVGYSVQEGKGKKYVVRERHAHAWTLVYYDGAWHDLDTTPGSWNAIEAQNASWLLPFRDFISEIWFQFSKWRWSSIEWRKYFLWAPVPLLAAAIAVFFLKKEGRSARRLRRPAAETAAWPGMDSELYLIERELAARGFERGAAEPWRNWVRRIAETATDPGPLSRLIALHYRYRFDPAGLDACERNALRSEAEAYLARIPRRKAGRTSTSRP